MVSFLVRRRFVRILCTKKALERIQAVSPEALVKAQPLVGAGEWSRVEAAQMSASAHLTKDQSRVLQHFDVLRGPCKRHRKRLGKLAYRSLTADQFAKHPPARGVAQGMKDNI